MTVRGQGVRSRTGSTRRPASTRGCITAFANAPTICQRIGECHGPIVSVSGVDRGGPDVPLGRREFERALSVNTTAAGGNAA
jgi:delta 1-pyrroline-5-carboxylate dehydrogenase